MEVLEIRALKDFYNALEQFVFIAPENSEGSIGQLGKIVRAHKAGIDDLKTKEDLKDFLRDTIDGQLGTDRESFIRVFNARDNGMGLFQAIKGENFSLDDIEGDDLSITDKMTNFAYKAHLAVGKVMPVINEINKWRKREDNIAKNKAIKRLQENSGELDNKTLGERFENLHKKFEEAKASRDSIPETVTVPGQRDEEWSLADLIDHALYVTHNERKFFAAFDRQ